MKQFRIDQKGFTLMEVLVSMTLLMIFLALAFMAYSFSIQSFQRADKQSVLQDQVRLASQLITDKLRYAGEVTLLGSCPTTPAGGYEYICTSATQDTIQHKFLDGATIRTVPLLSTNSSRIMTYQMAYQQLTPTRLTYTITSNLDDRSAQVTSELTLLNMQLNIKQITTSGSLPFKAIAYKAAP